MITVSERRIYVACLASYNAGDLHGEWIDADQSADEIQAEVQTMLEASPAEDAEEWAIHDMEGFYRLIDEYSSFETVADLAELLAEHGDAYAAYASMVGSEYATKEGFEEAYRGRHDSEEDYARELIDECYNLDEMMGSLACYFNYESYANDMFINDVNSEPAEEGGIHVFDRN